MHPSACTYTQAHFCHLVKTLNPEANGSVEGLLELIEENIILKQRQGFGGDGYVYGTDYGEGCIHSLQTQVVYINYVQLFISQSYLKVV